MSDKRKILSVIHAITGIRVSIGEIEIQHALKHFLIPQIKLLEIIEQVLLDPTEVYEEGAKNNKNFYLFYRLEGGRYLVAVVKAVDQEAHFVTIYPTGDKIKNKHKGMKKVNI